MKTTNTNAFLLIVTSSNIAQLPISWMLTWQRKAMTAGMRLSGKFWTRAMVYMLLLVLSGCKVTHSLEDMPQELKAVSELEAPMEQVAALNPTLKAVAALDAPLKNVAELKTPMEQVAALDPTLKAVAALDAPLKNVAELKVPLVALGAMATITQPTTYVPMFGFVGVVLFLAIWGGIKMGHR